MFINGINSYGMGYYNYQAAINNARLIDALSRNPKLQDAVKSVSPSNSSLRNSFDFVKEYTSSMSSLMKAASELKSTNPSGVMNDFTVTSSDSDVASVTERLPVRTATEIRLDVTQTAQAQTNVSSAVNASSTAVDNMDFTVSGSSGSVDVQVSAVDESGASRTNVQMLRAAAEQINSGDVGVRASVVEENGEASLKLESLNTGTVYGFRVDGELGAAAGANGIQTAAANAQYSVTMNGVTQNYSSSRNEITVNSGRIGVTLKSAGETTLRTEVDEKRLSSAVEDLVGSYNSALKLLNDNYDRGTGVDRQLRSLVRGLGSEQSLEKIGITVNKDATLNFDPAVLSENLQKDPSLVRDIISGTGGIANTAFTKASGGMNIQSSSLISRDIADAQYESMYSPFAMAGFYSHNSPYFQNNFYAVGLMMNYLI